MWVRSLCERTQAGTHKFEQCPQEFPAPRPFSILQPVPQPLTTTLE